MEQLDRPIPRAAETAARLTRLLRAFAVDA
jgi:hypothetical protein